MLAFHVGFPITQLVHGAYRHVGIGVAVAGVALDIWAAVRFRRERTGIVPFSEATVLVTSGPYGYTRNPMYLGMAIVLAGCALALGSVSPFLVIPAFLALITERFIVREEALLEAKFGAAYRNYAARVPRWLRLHR